jgi:hypothetical protein
MRQIVVTIVTIKQQKQKQGSRIKDQAIENILRPHKLTPEVSES